MTANGPLPEAILKIRGIVVSSCKLPQFLKNDFFSDFVDRRMNADWPIASGKLWKLINFRELDDWLKFPRASQVLQYHDSVDETAEVWDKIPGSKLQSLLPILFALGLSVN